MQMAVCWDNSREKVMQVLFRDRDGNKITSSSIFDALKYVGAGDCETLFIHSDIAFGMLEKGIKRKELLQVLHDQVSSLGVKNLIFPTFTYSFPNHEDFYIESSKTSMGAYNEYARKLENRFRTDDPLLSVSVPMSLKELFSKVSNHSLGEGSALDIIHHMDDVKFLFFGAEMADCFTYVHYVEKMMEVPYRFDMAFEGNVIYPDGRVQRRIQSIHTQCYGVKLPPKYDYFEKEMEGQGYLKKVRIADKYISCLSEVDAYREIKKRIDKDINYFLERPFRSDELIHKYTYSTENGRITHC